MRIYTYKLPEYCIDKETYKSSTRIYEIQETEDELYKQLTFHDMSVSLEDADIAFIPISFTMILYLWNTRVIDTFVKEYPHKNLSIGNKSTECKKRIIEHYWNLYVQPHLPIDRSIPHFIVYPYVLFDIDFSSIPYDIQICAYETKVSEYGIQFTRDLGTYERMIIIPYSLHSNKDRNQEKVLEYEDITATKKEMTLGFFGSLSDKQRPVLTDNRSIITELTSSGTNIYINSSYDLEIQKKLKYLFVLRGDTPTRLCFYQCFAYNCVPIIYKRDYFEYKKLFSIDLAKYCVILPNYNKIDSRKVYIEKLQKILELELSDPENYTRKVKDYAQIFDSIHYFTETISLPVKQMLSKVSSYKKHTISMCTLGDEYNTRLLPVKINSLDCIDTDSFSNNGKGVQYAVDKYLTSQYSLEVYFYTNLKESSLLAKNSDIIFIPFFTFLAAWEKEYFYDNTKVVNKINSIIEKIKDNPDKKYILVYSDVMWEDERCFIRHVHLPKNVFVITYEGVSFFKNIIEVPYLTHIHYKGIEAYSRACEEVRQFLVCYAGRQRDSVNTIKNIEVYNTSKDQIRDQWITMNSKSMYEDIDRLYLNSYFSIQPHGDRETRRGFYHSLQLGCVPVIFSNNTSVYRKVVSKICKLEDICIIVKEGEDINIRIENERQNYINYVQNIERIIPFISYDMFDTSELVKHILTSIDESY
jgi:hypothetical protein